VPGGVLSPRNSGDATHYVHFNDRPLGGHRLMLGMIPSGGRVLDVGCSGGYLAERLVARGSTVVGIELDPDAAAHARKFCAEVLVGDVEQIELAFEPASFDTIVCGDLIEHLRRPEHLLARVRPLLRPGGRLVLTTPNVANWTIRLQLLFGRFRYTVPLPAIGTPALERGAHRIGGLRPQLFAFQFVVAARAAHRQ
jgi:2-polyprenyl-3-methyl-5-hydroxy-6-metoxy-1,4-benzoquinol methylase